MEAFLLVILMLILLILSAFFSGSEAALFSLPSARIKVYLSSSDSIKKTIANLLRHPRDLLVVVFMLNTAVNILLQSVAANLFGDYSSWILKVGVPLILTLIFGEIVPKYIGLQYNFAVSHFVAPPIHFLYKILRPLQKAAVNITTPLSRFLFFFLRREPEMSQEEIEHILKTSEEHGIFDADESELILGYLKFENATVKEVMRPREEILYYDINEPLSKLIYLFDDQECTRVPVCEKNLEQILGVISAREFLIYREKIKTPKDLIDFLDKPFYVPENTLARVLLKRFNEQSLLLALVVDEYASISGLVAREDLIETVIGEVKDLRDQNHLYTRAGKDEIIASGKLELSEFNKIFNSNLESPEGMLTIGGWLVESLGEIPKAGSKYQLENFLFQVLRATPSRVGRLYIRKLKR